MAENIIADSLTVKPELYVSALPVGRIKVKAELYATYIPPEGGVREKTKVDLLRNISNPEAVSGDLSMQVVQSEKFSAELLRLVEKTEKRIVNNLRQVVANEKTSVDLHLGLICSERKVADISRAVQAVEKISSDTLRIITATNIKIVHGDVARQIVATEITAVDTLRQIGANNRVSLDTCLSITRSEKTTKDTSREIQVVEKILADASREIEIKEKTRVDTSRFIAQIETYSADTLLQMLVREKASSDLNRGIRESIRVDTARKTSRRERISADTIVRIPHILRHVIRDRSPVRLFSKERKSPASNAAIDSTFLDEQIVSITLNLQANTFADEITIELANDYAGNYRVGDTIELLLFDYPCNRMIVEEIICSKVDGRSTIKGKYDVEGFGIDTVHLSSAKSALSQLASDLDLGFAKKFKDFIPSNVPEQDDAYDLSYKDLVSTIFGWTTRVPQRQINVLIRGDTLLAIQRGREPYTFELPTGNYQIKTITDRIFRSSLKGSGTDYSDSAADEDDDNPIPFTGILVYSMPDVFLRHAYVDGLLISTETSIKMQTAESYLQNKSTTTYEYTSFSIGENEPADYLIQKNEENVIVRQEGNGEEITKEISTTTYQYDRFKQDLYLLSERTETNSDEETEIRITTHIPVGNGYYAHISYLDGEFQGATLSQGKPGNSVSKFVVAATQANLQSVSKTHEENQQDDDTEQSELEIRAELERLFNAVAEHEIPSNIMEKNSSLKKAPTGMLKAAEKENASVAIWEKTSSSELEHKAFEWINNREEYVLTVDLVSPVLNGIPYIDNIIDHRYKILLDGVIWFLVSNTVTFTPRKLLQSLTLIRWHGNYNDFIFELTDDQIHSVEKIFKDDEIGLQEYWTNLATSYEITGFFDSEDAQDARNFLD